MKLGKGKLGEKVVETIQKRRTLLVCLCAMVVFVTTYLLILPAITLDKDTAKDQGGIDLPKAEQIQDTDKPVANELSYEGKGYTVEAAFDAKAGLPKDTELAATEIASDNKDYDAWCDEALKAVQEAKGGEQVAGLEFAKFYDISLMSDGQELEPEAPVDISISYDKALKVADADHVRIVHFGADKKGNLVPEVLDPDDVDLDLKKGKMSGTAFAAESFSVYGVVYTVDFSFEFNGKQYMFSMNGEDAISLRALLTALHVYEAGEKDHKENTDNKETIVVQSSELNAERLTKEQETRINQFMKSIVSVEFSNPDLLVVVKTEEDTTLGRLCFENRINQPFTYTEKQDVVLDRYSAKYLAGDWVLISLKPFSTKEELKIVMDTGESLSIRVTDAANAPYTEDGVTVQTIANPGGTTFDVFDYWVYDSLRNAVGREAWPDYNSGWGAHTDTQGGEPDYGATGWNLNGNGNFYGINSLNKSDSELDAADLAQYYTTNPGGNGVYDGHALKFSPAWEGTVYNGTQTGTHVYYTPNGQGGYDRTDKSEQWRHLNSNGSIGLNNYTGNGNPMQGIVQNKLDDSGYPILTDSNEMGTNGESLEYLFNTDYSHVGKQSYGNVDHLLYVDPDGYYTYDSREYAALLGGDGNFTVTTQTETGSARGFWPFGTSKFWFGLHMKTQFSMPQNGEVLNPAGELKPMQFEFSGDDDTWIYVDGVLVGDGGGIHNRAEIDINFKDGTVRVTSMHNEGQHEGNFNEIRYLDDIFEAAEKFDRSNPGDGWIPVGQDGQGVTHYTFAPGTYHYFDFFYLERGGDESNLYIHYNLVSTNDFTAHKSYYNTDSEIARLERNQFQFELIGLEGKYRSVWNEESRQYVLIPASEQGAAQIQAIMPNDSGIDNYSYTLSNGVTVNAKILEKGVSEEGNVNFGSALISEEDKAECDAGNAPVYRYIIREIIPNDAVNADGVTWAEADNTQKAAGGFVKDNVLYDNNVYYMAARVTKWAATDSSGNVITDSQGDIIYQYGLEKTYYTDDTYTTVKDEVNFVNFENRFEPDYGSVDFTKVDGAGDPLQGAEFTLYKDEACTVPATDLDTDGHPVWTATSDSSGKVSFENVRVGTYYMKETTAPEGYKLSDTVYRVTIVDSKDKTKTSVVIRNDDETETPVTKIINTHISTEGLEVDKVWKGGEPSSDATIIYKLYQTSTRTKVGNYTVDVSGLGYGKPEWSNGKFFANDELTGDKTAIKKGSIIEIVITTTSDNWGFDTLNETTRITSNQTILSDVLAKISDGKIRQRTIRIQVTDDSTTTISLYGQLESCYDGNGGKPTITSRIISEPSSSEEGETKLVGTVTLGKNMVSSNIESAFQNLTPAIAVTTGTNDWTSVIKNLPENASEGDWNITYAYYVEEVETSVPSGYKLDFISPASAIPGETITIVNITETPEKINVVIKKTDNAENSTNYLNGAKFKLMYRSDSSGTFTNVSSDIVPELDSESQFTVPTAGITLTGLVDGQYQLQEISPPSGYVITNSTPVTFTVSGGAITSTQGTITGVRYTAASETSDAAFIVPNEPGAALPNTGGSGTSIFTILGSILILGAGVLLWRRRKLI